MSAASRRAPRRPTSPSTQMVAGTAAVYDGVLRAGSGSSASSAAGTRVMYQPAWRATNGSVSAASSSPSRRPGGRPSGCGRRSRRCGRARRASAPARTSFGPCPKRPLKRGRGDRAQRAALDQRPQAQRAVDERGRPLRMRQQHAVAALLQRRERSARTRARRTATAATRAAGTTSRRASAAAASSSGSSSAGSCATSAPASSSTGAAGCAQRRDALADLLRRRRVARDHVRGRDDGTRCPRRPRRAAASSESSSVAGPSSTPGSAWKWRSISTRPDRRSRPGA